MSLDAAKTESSRYAICDGKNTLVSYIRIRGRENRYMQDVMIRQKGKNQKSDRVKRIIIIWEWQVKSSIGTMIQQCE